MLSTAVHRGQKQLHKSVLTLSADNLHLSSFNRNGAAPQVRKIPEEILPPRPAPTTEMVNYYITLHALLVEKRDHRDGHGGYGDHIPDLAGAGVIEAISTGKS